MGWLDETANAAASSASGIASGGMVQNPQNAWEDITGQSSQKAAKSGYQGATASGQAAYDEMMRQNSSLDAQEAEYNKRLSSTYNNAMNQVKQPFADYDRSLSSMISQAEGQEADARKTYNGSIEPMMRSNMEAMARNANASMSLADAMNPNNPLAQQIRAQYDRQASGEMRQGGASSNVLSALGGLQVGMQQQGGPMTGSQQQAAYADASAPAGQRLSLGMQRAGDIRNAGDQAALDQTNLMYQAGLGARTGAAQSADQYMGGGRSFREGQQTSRQGLRDLYGEQANAKTAKESLSGDMFTQMNQADLESQKRKAERDAAAINAKYGTQIAARGAEAQQRAAGANQQGNAFMSVGGQLLKSLGGGGG